MSKSSFTNDMPQPYYWEQLDNFFHKLTAMESPRKNNDCYFYYYSTCTKGDNCTFRHEPSALGCETMCSYWQQGKCLNQHCNFRHMELRKNRKAIPCYWETQPSGCRKPHCPFQHKNPRETVNVETQQVSAEGTHEQKNERSDWNRRQVLENNQHVVVGELTNNEIECARQQARRINQTNNDAPTYGTPSVDPLVVNFEEESDNESTPTPVKNPPQTCVGIKTLEEIRLERIQQESAALYNYGFAHHQIISNTTTSCNQFEYDQTHMIEEDDNILYDTETEDLRHRLEMRKNSNLEVLSLNEIRKRRKKNPKRSFNVLEKVQNVLLQAKNELSQTKDEDDNTTVDIKIKTLDEIRAERALKASCSEQMSNAVGPVRLSLKRSLRTEFNTSTCKKSKNNEFDTSVSESMDNGRPTVMPDLVSDIIEPNNNQQCSTSADCSSVRQVEVSSIELDQSEISEENRDNILMDECCDLIDDDSQNGAQIKSNNNLVNLDSSSVALITDIDECLQDIDQLLDG